MSEGTLHNSRLGSGSWSFTTSRAAKLTVAVLAIVVISLVAYWAWPRGSSSVDNQPLKSGMTSVEDFKARAEAGADDYEKALQVISEKEEEILVLKEKVENLEKDLQAFNRLKETLRDSLGTEDK